MTRYIDFASLLLVLRVAACQEPPIRDLNVLIGKQVIVQRTVLCPPGTFTWSLAYAGKQATVVSLKPSKTPSLTPAAISSLPPATRALLEDQQKAATILVRLEDGTQLDTCMPIAPSRLSDVFEIVPGQTLEATPASPPVPASPSAPVTPPVPAPPPVPILAATPASTPAQAATPLPAPATPSTNIVAQQDSNKKDKASTYQLGTYLGFENVSDGTMTDNFHCGSPSLGSTTCSGGARLNGVTVYQIQTADGIWHVETQRQAGDTMVRRLGTAPVHLRSEKANPLDLLKIGDKVIFRVERHRKLNGTETDIKIPFANDPSKEETFVTRFFPSVAPVDTKPKPPSDNVRAMCEAHKLSPELEKQLCGAFRKESK